MIVNYSLRQAIQSCHHARKIGLKTVLIWRTFDHNGQYLLLVIPFFDDMHYVLFDRTKIRRIYL